MRGPVPKRSEERIRRNAPEIPIDRVDMSGPVHMPDLNIAGAHPMVSDLYYSLAESGQSQYYEPSDWQVARLLCYIINDMLSQTKLSAQMVMAVSSLFGDLMMTEGSRRRLRMEIEREAGKSTSKEDAASAQVIAMYKDMFN